MPFRAKLRKAFGGEKNVNDRSSSTLNNSSPKRTDIDHQKPGEKPRSRYRGAWDQRHQEQLHAFSFESAFRSRKSSIPSSYSPGGNHAQSRRSSWVSRARTSLGSRNDKEGVIAARPKSQGSHVQQVVEGAEDETEVRDGGISRPTTAGRQNCEHVQQPGLDKTLGHAEMEEEDSQLFTPEDLSKAMTAATLKPGQ